MCALTTPLNIILEVVIGQLSLKKDKDIKRYQIGKKELKRSQFGDDRISYTENPEDSTENLLK